jgi:hypothetical protein
MNAAAICGITAMSDITVAVLRDSEILDDGLWKHIIKALLTHVKYVYKKILLPVALRN